MKNIDYKNPETGKSEMIMTSDFDTTKRWGFSFFTNNEADAYKAAYIYRNSPHGVRVDFAGGVKMWMVTVFNKIAKDAKLDGAK